MTLRWRLSFAFLLVVAVPLTVAAIVVGRGVPQALDSAARNRLAASRAGAVSLVEQTCTTARLGAEVLAREAAAGAGTAAAQATAGQAATADVVGRHLAAYAVVTDTSGTVIGRSGTLTGGAEPAPLDLGSCSRGIPARSGLSAIADSVDVSSTSGRAPSISSIMRF